MSNEDSISVLLNGTNLLQDVIINDLKGSREITLDTGLNILIVFAENYGRVPPNTASLGVQLAEKSFLLDFTTAQNASATFMVAKIFYYPDKKHSAMQSELSKQQIAEKINQRKTVVIDSISVQSSEVTLAIWDDAVDDGDSISLLINNNISFLGIPVKKQPRFLKVSLSAGANHIVFMADNLGSIAPNTAMLEVIDGKRRKSYHINTNLGLNNAIRILYDLPVPK
ncbi:MAG: hypothetical protein EOO03_08540 [Chitinophagaceae bacterium]|nr:MAG: hypothetical protein EOO03_08540 [Chitinophagaceae bacterium]